MTYEEFMTKLKALVAEAEAPTAVPPPAVTPPTVTPPVVDPYAPPVYTLTVDPPVAGSTTVLARLRRIGGPLWSLPFRFWVDQRVASPNVGVTLPAVSTGFKWFVFDYDVEEITFPIKLSTPLVGSQAFKVMCQNADIYGNYGAVTQTVLVGLTGMNPALTPVAKTRQWDVVVKRPVPATWKLDFKDDLLATNFLANDSGKRADGTPCYVSRLPHGRFQNNGEVGIYTDPVLYPQTKPYQIAPNGKRALVAEKLDPAVTLSTSGGLKTFSHSTPIVSTETMPLFGYGRFCYKFALPNPTTGMWPAGWQLVLPHSRWPDLEHDTVEISFTGNPATTLPYQTHHWNAGNKADRHQGTHIAVLDLLPGFKHADPHEYWCDWTADQIRFGIDDRMMLSFPTRLKLLNPADPKDPNRTLMMLQIAIGGAGGDASKGVYPARMEVDYLAHYAMPV